MVGSAAVMPDVASASVFQSDLPLEAKVERLTGEGALVAQGAMLVPAAAPSPLEA